MKTVNVLTRKMGDFNVFQRTSDGYFDANEKQEKRGGIGISEAAKSLA